MAGVRFADLQARPMEFLDFTSLTLDEFPQLGPPFDVVFHARMTAWRMDGKPRIARRFTAYQTCPVPTPDDRLLGLDHGVSHPICLCARQKHLTTGGKGRWRTPLSCRVAKRGCCGHRRRHTLFRAARRVE
jgi:hypothetical protein